MKVLVSTREKVFRKHELEAQDRWGNPDVWDEARIKRLIWDHIPEQYHARIEAAQFFFLATSNKRGECDCSYKGGGPNLVRILGEKRLAFPDFDGNNAFMTLGNLLENRHVGMLFIDFTDGARLRINGRAEVHDKGGYLDLFPNAMRVIVVDVEQVVPNCAAYIPRLVPVQEAKDGARAGK